MSMVLAPVPIATTWQRHRLKTAAALFGQAHRRGPQQRKHHIPDWIVFAFNVTALQRFLREPRRTRRGGRSVSRRGDAGGHLSAGSTPAAARKESA